MKKFLLFAAATMVAFSATAANHASASKAKVATEKKAMIAPLGAFKSYQAKYAAENSFYAESKTKVAELIQPTRRADEETVELKPCYSSWTYFYDSAIMGGFIPKIMHEGSSFLVDGDKAYFAPFKNLDYVVGELNTSAENPYAEDGGVVYTFTSRVIATAKDKESGSTTELSLEPCVVENYTAVRSGETTFNGYYFADYNELYFPSSVCLALFDKNSAETAVFSDTYVVRALDLQPQEDLNQYISKGTFNAKSYYGSDHDISGDCKIFLASDGYYVQGAGEAPSAADSWVMFESDETDPTIATVFQNQYLGTFNFYDDSSRTTTHPGIVVTVGLLQEEGELTAFNKPDYESTYTITDNEDQTTTIANTANTVFGEYIYAESDDNAGMFNAFDMSINITYEPATGIENVESKSSKNTGAIYNLNGQKVNESAKGLLIRDGKKFIVK